MVLRSKEKRALVLVKVKQSCPMSREVEEAKMGITREEYEWCVRSLCRQGNHDWCDHGMR